MSASANAPPTMPNVPLSPPPASANTLSPTMAVRTEEGSPRSVQFAAHHTDGEERIRKLSTKERHRKSSFAVPHHNSIAFAPVDQKGLEAINMKDVPWWTSQRFILSLICFCGFLVLYAQRVNLSIAIVSMVDHTHLERPTGNSSSGANETSSYIDEKCPGLEKKSAKKGEFKWSKPLQGLILGAFFWGYLVLQVVGGYFSERYGARRVVASGMVPVAVMSLLTPVTARANPYLFLVLRVLMGVGESVLYPSMQALWSRWSPPNERSRLIGFSYAGGQFGNAMIFPIGGFLSAYGFDGGWPSVFYVMGICGFVWCVVWLLFTADGPELNPRISDIEKKYILLSVGTRAKNTGNRPTPWKSIFTSRAVWSILVAHTCGNYGVYMQLTQIPTYMKEVLLFDIEANGVYSMLPYLAFWLFTIMAGLLADLLITKEILSVAWTRKLMSCIGMIGPGCFLIGTGFMNCDQQMEAVAMLTIAVGLCGFQFSGFFVNHGDIAPAYAGTLFGITNTSATVPGIVAPYVVAALTTDASRAEWQTAFYVAAAVYFFGAAFYVVMGQAEVQPWADNDEQDTTTTTTTTTTAAAAAAATTAAVTIAEPQNAETRKDFTLSDIQEVSEGEKGLERAKEEGGEATAEKTRQYSLGGDVDGGLYATPVEV